MNKLLLLILVFVFACQSGKNSGGENESEQGISLDSLKSEVLFIHDEVMPKMGELRRTRKDLMLQADSLMESDSTQAMVFQALANDIGNANEGMMQWMRDYEPDFEGTEEEVRAYFEAQKKAIQKVKDDMEGSLSKGIGALGQNH